MTGSEGTAITIGEGALAHVLESHTGEVALAAGKSIFHAAEGVPGLIRAAEGVAPVQAGIWEELSARH